MQTSYKVSNLFSFERRCTGGRISSDSETMEVEGLQRNRNRYVTYVTAFQSRYVPNMHKNVRQILDYVHPILQATTLSEKSNGFQIL